MRRRGVGYLLVPVPCKVEICDKLEKRRKMEKLVLICGKKKIEIAACLHPDWREELEARACLFSCGRK
jgi:hypothetical protein